MKLVMLMRYIHRKTVSSIVNDSDSDRNERYYSALRKFFTELNTTRKSQN